MAAHSTGIARTWLIVVAFAAVSTPVHAQRLTYHGSVQLSTGDYFFAERTRSVYISNGLTAELGRFTFSTTVPIVLQDSPWISYSAVGTIPTGGTDQEAVGRRQGGPGSGQGSSLHKYIDPLGSADGADDPVVAADTVSYSQVGIGDPGIRLDVEVVRPSDGRFSVRLAASAKPPIADVDRGFGTGSWDAGIGVGSSARIGRLFVFFSSEYWWFGDMPELRLNESWSYGVAVGLSIVPAKLSTLVSYSGFTEIIDGVEPPRQVGLGVSLTPTPRYSVSLSVYTGVTESASDFSLGIGWTVGL